MKLKNDELDNIYRYMSILEQGDRALDIAIREIASAVKVLAWHIDELKRSEHQ